MRSVVDSTFQARILLRSHSANDLVVSHHSQKVQGSFLHRGSEFQTEVQSPITLL